MALQTFREVPQTLADWDRYLRSVAVQPDPNSVGNDELQDGAVVTAKLADSAVATPKIADDAVTDAKLRNSGACSIIGRATNTAGSPTDISIGADNKFLVRRSGQLTADVLLDSDIPSAIARDTEVATSVSAAITAHEAAVDPHPQYLTQAEGDARYQPLETTGTFTAAVTGCTTVPTVTARYVIQGNIVQLFIPSNAAASNTTSLTITGLPAGLQPARDQGFVPILVQDNSTLLLGLARVLTTGVIDIRPGAPFSSTGFTAAGNKGHDFLNLTYNLL